MELKDIKNLVSFLGLNTYWAIIAVLLLVCLFNYDKLKIVITDLWCLLARTIGWGKRIATKRKLEDTCRKSFTSITQEVPELELPLLKINWVAKDEENIVINDGEAIVFLKFNPDNTQNIINITSAYVKETVLTVSKTYMPSQIREAIDYTVIKKCLNEIQTNRYALSHFIKNNHEVIKQSQTEIDKIGNIDDAGLMSRILFREYFEWGNRIAGRNIDEKYQKEASGFLDFLYNITSRGYDDNTQLQYISENIKVGVLLVAKIETFAEKGEQPYVRRIREGFAKGIRTFYLLARNEKLDIVHEVYCKLIQSGNYELLNGPKEYRDSLGRDNICYCVEINSNGDMAKTYSHINNAIEAKDVIEAVITSVHTNELLCLINTIEVRIPREKISDVKDLKLYQYFKSGNTIEFIPEEIDSKGVIIGSILETNSNPQKMVNNKFSVGSNIVAIVDNPEDDFVWFRVKDSDMRAIAFRKNLTYSHYVFLHHLFPIGTEHSFIIDDIDYISNKLYLKLSNLVDPWDNIEFKIGQEVVCKVMQKKDNCIITEIKDGVKAILPYTETSWFDSEINLAKRLKINDNFAARIKSINVGERIVILMTKSQESPYDMYYNILDQYDYKVEVKIIFSDSHGVYGLIEDKYRVFIPQSETHIGDNYHKYKVGKYDKVFIKSVSSDRRSFIGSYKPFIEHPMQWFSENYQPGIILSKLSPTSICDKCILFNIKCHNHKSVMGLLPISEVTNLCYLDSLEPLYKTGRTFPLVITEIDMNHCVVVLSLKNLLNKNKERIHKLDYTKNYNAYVVKSETHRCVIIIENIWIEGILTESRKFVGGEKIIVRPVSLRDIPEFIEEQE